ncbi:Inosose dehydratase [Pseudoalteromonas sp. P1-9]|uniref:sugar phosphate isomerase/epimerase family protein n=1 Tax=Pseudoalteromonas sp. P1-9 TaxID=1710354 RepID=UPI0006D60DA6|nr:sugar phosphate isomerase/epimerase [Pseudoalteromonas sp. P1-9]KPV93732.1 Inosose dehydratase [Pseudoalteromonas sp. P1-9]
MINKTKKLVSALTLLCAGTLVGCQTQPSQHASSELQVQQISQADIPAISVQLWSVNDTLAKDFKGTVTAIADMGFDAVELAGDFGPYKNDPEGLKAFLDGLGLKVSGAHVKMPLLTDDKIAQTIAFYQKMGAPMLIVPADRRAEKADTIVGFVEDLNKVAKVMREKGMGFGFHNHDRELVPYKDSTFWDYIAENTAQDFILQLDVGWVTYAKKDPVKYIHKYPNRTVTTHYKAKFGKASEGKKPLIGQDTTDWAAVLRANIAVGGTQYLVVEQEEYPDGLSQLEAVAVSKKGLDKIIVDVISQ